MKKKPENLFPRGKIKTYLTRKLILFFISLSLLNVSGSIYSQNVIFNPSENLTYRELENDLIVLTPVMEDLQQVTVTGRVTDASGESLPGVSVVIEGTTTGTVTDAEGKFSLVVPNENSVIVFSYVGYSTNRIPLQGRSVLEITLTTDAIDLDEIVVVGYGTQRRATLTGAVTSVRNEDLSHTPSINVSNALAGMLPGLIALNRSGSPGADESMVLIRGRSTTGNTSPLVVVDGIADYPGWQRINPNDIESISVLKDASAAIYGSRAANGVILITTKRGRVGKPTVNYSVNQGIVQPTRIPEMADAVLYAEFVNELFIKQGKDPRFTQEEVQKFRDGTDPFYPNTDWYGETLKRYSSQRQHNLNIDGGSEGINYLVSATYANQDGIFKDGIHNNDDYSILGRLDSDINDYIRIGVDLNTALQDRIASAEPFGQLGSNRPTEPVFWPNGMPSAGVTGGQNPAVMVTDAWGYNNTKGLSWIAKGSIDITIPWVQGLSIDGYYYHTNANTNSKNWRKPWVTNSYNPYIQQYAIVNGGPPLPTLEESTSIETNSLINLRVNYERRYNNHYLSTFIAAEQSEGFSNDFSAFRRDFPSAAIDQMFAGSVVGQSTDGSASESARQNLFGRVSYNFKEKYLFDFNYRYDGSSNFPKDRRWGFFPGGSIAWNISEENFIRENADFITYLKLRASYGQIGNDAVPSFQWLSTYAIGSDGYPFGITPSTTLGLRAGVTPNPNITWEVSEITNLGLDATLWEGRLGMAVDLFKQRRSNILARRDLAIPFHAGLSLPNENIGVVENKGFELELSHLNQLSGVRYRIAGNVAFARNRIIDISEPIGIPDHQKQEGSSLGALLLYEAVGIFRTEEELERYPVVPGTVVGDLMYKDFDGDGVITQNDMRRVNNTNTPEVTFGFNMSGSYRQFSLWAHFSGQARAWRQFHKHSKDGGHNSLRELLENRYTPGSMDSKYPIIPDSETQTMDISGFPSTFWLKNAYFVRLKTLEFSYQLPDNLASRIGAGSMRVYINGHNLFTIDELEWYDPEGDHLTGAFYPQNKIYNLGINVSF
jgi:TonB-dependent starch-binding outer membrane protein SusC